MPVIRTIVCPTDHSTPARLACEQALYLAEQFGAHLQVVHVAPPGADLSPGSAKGAQASVSEEIERWLIQQAEKTAVAFSYGEVLGASPADAICRVATAHEADLLVMGMRDHRERSVLCQRSITTHVVQHAPCPVWVARPRKTRAVERVLVPIDFYEASLAAFDRGQALAQHWGAELMLLHVVEPAFQAGFVYAGTEGDTARERVVRGAVERLRPYAESARTAGVGRVTVHVRVGYPGVDINAFAEEHEVDLMVLPTHGRSCDWRLPLGSVADRILQRQACPLYMLHTRDSVRSAVPQDPRAARMETA
ncbi:MAG: universal stress protein [Bacteroidota bacterium]